LKEELKRHGDVRRAVGAYHSSRLHRAGPYADKVLASLDKEVNIAPAPAASIIVEQSREMKVSGTSSVNSMKVRRKI
jgi:hypothetical protein